MKKLIEQLETRIRIFFQHQRETVTNRERSRKIKARKDYRKALSLYNEIVALEKETKAKYAKLAGIGWEISAYWQAKDVAPVRPSGAVWDKDYTLPEVKAINEEETRWMARLVELEVRTTLKDPNAANAVLAFMAELDTRQQKEEKR